MLVYGLYYNICTFLLFVPELECPSGFAIDNTVDRCEGGTLCCVAKWSLSCGKTCAKTKCLDGGGKWIPKDYTNNPYTCQLGMC